MLVLFLNEIGKIPTYFKKSEQTTRIFKPEIPLKILLFKKSSLNDH